MNDSSQHNKRSLMLNNISMRLEDFISKFDDEELNLLDQQEDDVDLLVKLLCQGLLMVPKVDKYQESLIRGSVARLHLLDELGGYLDFNQVVEMRNIKLDEIKDLIATDQLTGQSYCGGSIKSQHSNFQDSKLIPCLDRALVKLKSKGADFWSRCLFLNNPHGALFLEGSVSARF